MELILSSNQFERTKNEELKYIHEDLQRKIKSNHPWNPINSVKFEGYNGTQMFNGDIFERVIRSKDATRKEAVSSDKYLCMIYPSWLVLIETCGNNDMYLDVYASLLNEMAHVMTSFLGRYELLLSKFVSDKYMLTLRLYRHECAHIALAISKRNNKDYRQLITSIQSIKEKKLPSYSHEYRNFFRDIRDKNLEAACNDLEANTKLIIHMADTIGLLSGLITRDNLDLHEPRSHFTIGHDIVTKWKLAYKTEHIMCENHKHINVASHRHERTYNTSLGESVEIGERSVYHRKRLIDLVIFNLIDNSLKYSHWGTNIYVTIGSRSTRGSDTFPFIIENYGYEIDLFPKAFELYYRRPENVTHIEGDGLGLYVVKTISDMLELNVKYTRKHVSKLNVGLFHEYMQNGKSNDVKECIVREMEMQSELVERIINKNKVETISEIAMPQADLERDIHNETFHVMFEISIQTNSVI